VYSVNDQSAEFPANDQVVLPMVMSLGSNPYYKNERMTAEIHIMHNFNADFYGYELKTLVLGYIRPEFDYTSRGKCMIPANGVQVLIRVNRGAHRRHRDGQEGRR